MAQDEKLNLPEPAAIVASALFLMTRHATTGCPCKAQMVIRQLEFLAQHPSEQVSPMLRQVCRKLIVEWHNLVYQGQKAERAPAVNPALH